MLAIGRGLMAGPAPYGGRALPRVAPMLVERSFQILRKINDEKAAVLLAEQNVFNALNMAHRAYVIENGRIVLSGPGPELLKDEHLKRAYLGI